MWGQWGAVSEQGTCLSEVLEAQPLLHIAPKPYSGGCVGGSTWKSLCGVIVLRNVRQSWAHGVAGAGQGL